ncbi:MAG TPA: Nramp family divalent metal transporter [Stellaceae bacterium]|nr:Nramp family divalent metal transporter [Stellaceae bacterium]
MTLSEWTVQTARDVLEGRRHGWRGYSAFAGAGVIVSIAFVDPGNFATNVQAGARYGYGLLWAVLLANLIAMLFQALSARLGIVTGRNLAELCREHFPMPVVMVMWLVSEIAAMATDLAEFVGAGIGLSLLFHIPLLAGMAVTALIVYGILMSGQRGFRPVELIVGGFIAVIALCYVVEMFIAQVDWTAAAVHSVVPQIPDAGALLLTVGIIGATVMPHAIYLHSGLTQSRIPPRNEAEKARIVRISNREVVVALAIAGAVNMAMVMMASAAFHAGHSDVAQIEAAYDTLTPLLGVAAASVFLLSLLASGVASSAIGTMAGQMIMQGFVGFAIPLWVRRLVTMLPAFVVVAIGVDATRALVVSQVVLSLALPLPMITLILFTRRADIMGKFASGRIGGAAAILGTATVLSLNLVLVLETLGVAL